MEQERAEQERKHSKMGIASFALAVVATAVIVVLFVVTGMMAAQALQDVDPQNNSPQEVQRQLQESPAATGLALAGAGILGCVLVYLVGFGLGFAGLVQSRRRKLFAVLGAGFNGLAIFTVVVLTLLGLVAGTL
ncbi:MAG: hypothetical protein ACFB50_18545 [Rubrobacteraceae bacterium]